MWTRILFWAVTQFISFLLRPTPEVPKPATLDDFGVPVASPGRELPLIGGTVWIDDPQVAWRGDFKAVAIKSKGGKK